MKIMIIGSGLLGVSTAYFLSQQGHRVMVFDRQEGPGMETSFANGGMLTPSQAEPWNQPGILGKLLSWMGKENSPFLLRPTALFSLLGWGMAFMRHSSPARFRQNLRKNARLAAYSLQVLKDLRQRHTLSYEQACKGTAKVYATQKDLQQGEELSELAGETGSRFQMLDVAELIDLEPALSDVSYRLAGGIYYPDDESGDAHKFCRHLAGLAEKSGAVFRYHVAVTRLEQSAGRITGVATSVGKQEADAYVLAAGSYTPLIAKPVGLKLPIRPIKGYSLTLDLNGWEAGPSIPVVDDMMHSAITPLGTGLRVTGTAEFDGYNQDIRPGRIENMFRLVSRLYPAFIPYLDRASAAQWACLRPYCCDGVPLLGQTALANLYLNTGHGHLGWTMAAGSGKLVADLISGQDLAMDISPYRLDRF
ncbi:MAG: D-amino acid dehydrogenase [Gammaproteobacteria bacterium]